MVAQATAAPPVPMHRGLSTVHIPPEVASVECWDGGNLVTVRLQQGRALPPKGGIRGTIGGFSPAARLRLKREIARTRCEVMPWFVHLTYPDHFPDDPKVWKQHLDAFLKRLRRLLPEAAGYWRLDVIDRKSGENEGKVAPHFHLLLWLPGLLPLAAMFGRKVGDFKGNAQYNDLTCVELSRRVWHTKFVQLSFSHEPIMPFTEWLSITWADVVGGDDSRHVKAGTKASLVRSRGGIQNYAAHYIAHEIEADLLETFGGVGRWWGSFNSSNIPMADKKTIHLAFGDARRWLRIGRKFAGLTGRSYTSSLTWFGDGAFWLSKMRRQELFCPPGSKWVQDDLPFP